VPRRGVVVDLRALGRTGRRPIRAPFAAAAHLLVAPSQPCGLWLVWGLGWLLGDVVFKGLVEDVLAGDDPHRDRDVRSSSSRAPESGQARHALDCLDS